MSVHYVQGDLLEANVNYICHQVNCQGKMNSGIAKQIRRLWPEAYNEYILWHKNYNDMSGLEQSAMRSGPTTSELMLGNILIHAMDYNRSIIHMAAQEHYGYDSKRYTSYDAFWACLGEIKNSIPKGSKIGFPARIGCVRGGANWEVIKTMIEQVLGKDYEVYIYDYDKG